MTRDEIMTAARAQIQADVEAMVLKSDQRLLAAVRDREISLEQAADLMTLIHETAVAGIPGAIARAEQTLDKILAREA
jgi:hypothetical protein